MVVIIIEFSWTQLQRSTNCPSGSSFSLLFSYKLSCSSTLDEPPTLEECHHLTFREFQIKKSQVKSVLQSLNVTKSVGDDRVSPRILNSSA